MKKFFYLFFIVAAFLTFSVSCSKAEQDTEIDNPSEEKPVPQDATKIRFNISLASEGGKATIASDGNVANVTWNTGDQVTVYAVDDEGVKGMETVEVSINPDDNTKAVIETVLPAGCTYYAAFPKCESATFNGDVMTVSEPAAATAQTNSNCQVAVSKAEKIGGGSYSLQFKNVNHLLKFTVSETLAGTVKSAELVSQTSGGAVSYTQVAYDFNKGTSIYKGTTVTSLKRTVVKGDNFIALAPEVSMSDGFCLKLKDENGKVVKLFFYDNEFTTARNGGSNIKDFENKLYTNLSKDETANCYLINQADATDSKLFCFYAKTAGNGAPVRTSGDKTSLATESVSHLWSTLNTSTKPATDAIVKSVTYHKAGYASFEYVSTGNVILAARNSGGTIIWSWHLWLPIDKVENVVHFKTGSSMNKTNMLNANLGALKTNYESGGVRDLGFFYQWGRKDPFVSAATRTTSDPKNIQYVAVLGAVKDFINRQDITGGQNKLDTTIRHPTWFIRSRDKNDKDNYYDYFRDWYGTSETTPVKFWSIEKTMYDPCPPGYKVPRVLQGPWGYFASGAPWDNTKKGRSFTNQDGKTIWHPAAGFLHRCSGKYSGSKNSLGVNGGYWGVDDDEPVNSSSRGTKMYNYYWYFEENGCRFNIDISGNYTNGYGKVTDYITKGNTVSGDLNSGRGTGRSVRCCKSTEFL